ncbi:uncharacterized protein L3040_002770 [Drepanopeziza brunnea f. sp. 'multigermtubi']|uniref:uncharacterized protein n=1 Tax=Drepanopeziza brunnea f. sp. 'multigermtubi' TaxID=698441 RepID=UPI00238DF9FF|nr:hypothetical protein L3040_002770 [Drepanopeziza brunnea f. sp. 'multigermtubi']
MEGWEAEVDLDSVDFPWEINNRFFSKKEEDEIELFINQARFQTEEQRRRDDFKQYLRRLESEFERNETKIQSRLKTIISYKLWGQDVDSVRTSHVPAYTFTKFPKLPVELQTSIWSFAARVDSPQTHRLSLIDSEGSVYADDDNSCDEGQLQLVNTLYDKFSICGHRWSDFKVLIDQVLHFNNPGKMINNFQRDIQGIQKIRFLAVDFNIFSAIPVLVWEQFSSLELLTIVTYPYCDIRELDYTEDSDHKLELIKPQKWSMYGRRADWILERARKAFQAAKQKGGFPKKIPKLEVRVRKIDDEDFDYLVQEEWTDDIEDYMQLHGINEYDHDQDDEQGLDSVWFQQAKMRMHHVVARPEIEALEQLHYPAKDE